MDYILFRYLWVSIVPDFLMLIVAGGFVLFVKEIICQETLEQPKELHQQKDIFKIASNTK